jgi:hypothetical protein
MLREFLAPKNSRHRVVKKEKKAMKTKKWKFHQKRKKNFSDSVTIKASSSAKSGTF